MDVRCYMFMFRPKWNYEKPGIINKILRILHIGGYEKITFTELINRELNRILYNTQP